MSANQLSPQLQDQINRLQQLRTQVQMISQQRQQVEMKLREIDEALGELEKIDASTPVYKSVGAILIKSKGKSSLQKELKQEKETLDVRKSTLEKQESRSREKMSELQSKVQNALSLGSDQDESSE
jgi:prefoldin beta subunit